MYNTRNYLENGFFNAFLCAMEMYQEVCRRPDAYVKNGQSTKKNGKSTTFDDVIELDSSQFVVVE